MVQQELRDALKIIDEGLEELQTNGRLDLTDDLVMNIHTITARTGLTTPQSDRNDFQRDYLLFVRNHLSKLIKKSERIEEEARDDATKKEKEVEDLTEACEAASIAKAAAANKLDAATKEYEGSVAAYQLASALKDEGVTSLHR